MSPSAKDAVLIVSLRAAAAIAGAIALFIVVFLAFGAWPSLAAVGIERFFTDPSWRPAGGPANGQFNLTPLLVGTLATTAGAMALAAPLGLASALFCTFYAPRILGIAYRRMIELLAGVPSVVYGFWGLVVLAPLVRQWRPPGQSLLAATLILALMVR